MEVGTHWGLQEVSEDPLVLWEVRGLRANLTAPPFVFFEAAHGGMGLVRVLRHAF